MATYTQTERSFRAGGHSLDKNELLLTSFAGEEGMSMPFSFTLELSSPNPSIDPAALLRKPITITIDLAGRERVIHGLVKTFAQFGREGDLTMYRAEMVPWLWLLSLSSDCRIFQHQSVTKIAETIFGDLGFKHFDLRCSKTYPARKYCVQYGETHLDFVSRLFEEEGIFYFFEHSEDKHELIIADVPSKIDHANDVKKIRMIPGSRGTSGEEFVTELNREHSVGSGKVTLRDYDPLKPSANLQGQDSGEQQGELYDYNGKFTVRAEGDRYAQLRLEEREALLHVVRGSSNVRGLQSGAKFELAGHYRPDANIMYQVIRVRHAGRQDSFQSGGGGGFSYLNDFEAIPYSVPFRPPRVTRKPRMHGTQTAVVVGPAGEEIWTDTHGCVRIHFFWDRKGQKDGNDSCPVRVSTQWAGKGWGFVSFPRINQEVIVDFLHGDPDQPIIVGMVYNAEQTPAYGVPTSNTQSGIKTRSSPGGGEAHFNEIRFEDKKGEEELFIHAEKDELHEVENDREDSVGHDETRSVGHDQSVDVGNDQSIDVKGERSLTVGKDETVTIEGSRTEKVSKDETITISGSRTETVTKDETIDIKKNRTTTIGKIEKLTVQGARSVDVANDDKLTVGKKLTIVATDEISLTSGDASITLKKDGTITIAGKNINLNGSGAIKLTADGDVALKGQAIKEN